MFTRALNITLQQKTFIVMLEIRYLMAYLFDFCDMPLIPLSEVIDLYFAALCVKRLHRTLPLVFPVLREAVALSLCCSAGLGRALR